MVVHWAMLRALFSGLLVVCLWGADDRIKVDNEFVRVITATVEPHNKGPMHRHEFNRVIVALDAGELEVVSEDGRIERQHWKPGQVEWSPATAMHTSENVGARAFRLVEVEIKKPAPDVAAARNPGMDPVALDPRHNILIFDNLQVRVFRSWREPGGEEKMHEHTGAGRLSVLLTDLEARVRTPDGAVVPQHGAEGDVLWSGPVKHAASNTGPKRFEMVVIEVK